MLEPNLRIETEKLARSWLRHNAVWLDDYLVAGVEDPRYNLQSIFSRHFLVYALAGKRFEPLMEEEYRFAAALNWFLDLTRAVVDAEELQAVLHALKQGADNAEGREIPRWVVRLHQSLPAEACGTHIANYMEALLSRTRLESGKAVPAADSLDLFAKIWREVLQQIVSDSGKRLTVLEPACGSANDYRFLDAYGLAPLLDYTGFDLCDSNVQNARQRFPSVRFEVGNVFGIAAQDGAYEVCFVHDLLEHLSPEGLEKAVAELCRVTRRGLCVNFFQMNEMPDHVIRPMDEYYWNTLSLDRVRELFLARGFAGQVFHIGRFLQDKVGADTKHNSNAYTFLLQPRRTQ
jgi:SAM-dependent methyltransferase